MQSLAAWKTHSQIKSPIVLTLPCCALWHTRARRTSELRQSSAFSVIIYAASTRYKLANNASPDIGPGQALPVSYSSGDNKSNHDPNAGLACTADMASDARPRCRGTGGILSSSESEYNKIFTRDNSMPEIFCKIIIKSVSQNCSSWITMKECI